MRKIVETRNPLSNTINDTSTIMRNPLPELCREGLCMIVLNRIAKGIPCFHDFSHGASLHPYSFIFALVPHIIFRVARSYAHACIYV